MNTTTKETKKNEIEQNLKAAILGIDAGCSRRGGVVMKTSETTIDRRQEATTERLKEEDQTRAPLIKLITDALPVFREEDFDSWATARIIDLADRVKIHNTHGKVDDAYAKVGV